MATASQWAGDHPALVYQRSVGKNGAGNAIVFAVRVLVNDVIATMASPWAVRETTLRSSV